MTTPIGVHELPQRLDVYGPIAVPDDGGGTTITYGLRTEDVPAKVNQPSASEQVEAAQAGATAFTPVHFRPDADIRRGDELRRADGDNLRVRYTVYPSHREYLRADCEIIESEGDAP